MLKHSLLGASLLVLLSTAADANPSHFVTGSFVELGLGVGSQKNKALGGSSNYALDKNTLDGYRMERKGLLTNMTKVLGSKNSSGFVPALNFGMLFLPNPNGSLVLGFTLGGALGGGSTKMNYSRLSAKEYFALRTAAKKYDALNNGSLGTNTLFIKDRGHLKAAFRLGAAFGKVMPFANFGVAFHRLAFKMDGAQRFSKWDPRLVLGLGVDYAVSQNVVVGLLSEVHIGGKRSYGMKMYDGNKAFGSAQFRSKSYLVLANFKYMFPRMQ